MTDWAQHRRDFHAKARKQRQDIRDMLLDLAAQSPVMLKDAKYQGRSVLGILHQLELEDRHNPPPAKQR